MLLISLNRTKDPIRKCLGEVGKSDEMNIHIPQSIEAEADIMVNSRASGSIVTASKNGPINGPVQDALVSSLILTMTWSSGFPYTMIDSELALSIYREAEISETRILNLLCRGHDFYPDYITLENINNFTEYKFTKEIPGSLFLSILFPSDFCYKKLTNILPNKPKVRIEDGIITPTSGPLCRKSIGGKNGSIIHDIWKRSQEMCLCLLSDLQQITDRWLPTHGFSIGPRDCFANSGKEIAKILIETRINVATIISKGNENENRLEAEINTELNTAMAVGPKLAQNSMEKDDKNGFNIMRNSGAKGSVINLVQIVGFVGQQNFKNKRMPKQLTHNTRCLTCFLPGDNSPEARGFIENNYICGLTLQEAFFHAIAGRVGVISTAMKTSETGYIQKKISRKIEDAKVWIDGSVRDANGRIISFMYGDDGMDAKKLVPVKNLDFPFFVNPKKLAKELNSEAKRSVDPESLGLLRLLDQDEISQLMEYIKSNGIETSVTNAATKNLHETLK